MRKKAIFAALLVTLTLMPTVLSSCSFITVNFDNIFPYEGTFAETETDKNGDSVTSDTDEGAEKPDTDVNEYVYTGMEDAKAALASVRNYTFEGASVFISTTATDKVHILTSDFDDSAEIDENDYSAAVYERNRMVEEKLSCTIRYRQTTLDEMRADLKSAIKTEDYYADLLCVSTSELAVLAEDGYLFNLRSVPFFDTDKKYFNASGVNALSAGYYNYGVAGTATVDPDDILGMFVNLDILEKVTDVDVEALAENGEWTWDKALEIAKLSSFSCADSVGILADVIGASGRLNYVKNPHNGTRSVILPEGAELAVGYARAIASETKEPMLGTSFTDSFSAGASALHIGRLSCMDALAKAEFDWTVVPMPKLTAEQSAYASYMSANTLAYAVPITTKDTDGAGVLIEAIFAASYGMLRDTYVKYHMYHTVRLSSTLDMIELIWDTPYFDFAHMLGAGYVDIKNGTYMVVRDAAADGGSVETLFDKRDSAANKALKKYFEPSW